MKINLQMVIRVCMVLMMIVFIAQNVYASWFTDMVGGALDRTRTGGSGTGGTGGRKPTEPTALSVSSNEAVMVSQRIWGTAKTVVQIFAVIAIVTTGVRYMFASADIKSDIKGQTIVLIVGAVLVFAASTFAEFVYNAATDIL